MPAANIHRQPANQELTLETISEHVREHIGQWLAEQSLAKPPVVYEVELRERMIRVEEELKHQRELMKQGFDLMEKRLEAMSQENNRRFEAIDKRFEAMSQESDRRFDMVDKRFEEMNRRFESMDKRFESMDKRFEAIDRRFETMSQESNRRFEEMNKRIERLIIWSSGTTIGMGSLVIAALRFL